MQLTKNLILLATFTATALAVALPNETAASKCNTLGGAMKIQSGELPEGVSASDVRECVEHPHGRERNLKKDSLAPFENGENNSTELESGRVGEMAAAKCYTAAPYGCSDGYCWKTCGNNGEWCWTAYKGGLGSWIECSSWRDCGTTTYSCGIGGPAGGCSC